VSGIEGKRIVLGVTGGIAAYKAVEVCRRLVDAGAHVIPVLSAGAERFVGATTFSTLASEPVVTSLWDIGVDAPVPGRHTSPIPHTRLGQTADLILVCPATARLIGTYAAGISSDLITATLIATTAPVLLCPAMHTEMWDHAAVQENLATLRRRGVHVVPPAEGRLAGGDHGRGRLADPATIVDAVHAAFTPPSLAGVRVLVTAGGTREPIDPVRFIGNRSSGKQGHALAEEAAARGADVHVVTTVDRPLAAGIRRTRVDTAQEMHDVVLGSLDDVDVVLMAAAVADFRPVVVAEDKIKKDTGVPAIVLESTPDILAAIGARRRADQVVVGFAAETSSVRDHALGKLERKRIDAIVANDVAAPEVGFEHDTNQVVVLVRDASAPGGVREVDVPLRSKRAVAAAVVDVAESLWNDRRVPPTR
jgi:phosphopantothenoylcysteine decarboxylase/phosphopantothenate--cysteine ligase